MNQEVYAVTDGKVSFNYKVMYKNGKIYLTSYGKYAILEFTINKDTYAVYYAHMNKLPTDIEEKFKKDFEKWAKEVSGENVSVGSIIGNSYREARDGVVNKTFTYTGGDVEATDVIGYAGNNGNSNGAHLHFEIRKNKKVIDPTTVINGLPKKIILLEK